MFICITQEIFKLDGTKLLSLNTPSVWALKIENRIVTPIENASIYRVFYDDGRTAFYVIKYDGMDDAILEKSIDEQWEISQSHSQKSSGSSKSSQYSNDGVGDAE